MTTTKTTDRTYHCGGSETVLSITRIVVLMFLPLHFAEMQSQAQSHEQPVVQVMTRSAPSSFVENDRNEDEKISRDEATEDVICYLTLFDSNNDGFLDRDEFRQLPERREGKRGWMLEAAERLIQTPPEGIVIEPDLTYREGGKSRQNGANPWQLDLVRPAQDRESLRPAIVIVHGGGWQQGDKRLFLREAIEFAQQGYVCVTINYRFLKEEPFGALVGDSVADVKCAVRWLRANAQKYHVDPERIGGYGHSAGGHLIAMLGLTGSTANLEGDGPHQDRSSRLQAVCCSAAPTDLTKDLNGPERDWLFDKLSPDQCKRFSPISYVSDKAPPLLIIHGADDQTVLTEQGDSFVNALQNSGAKQFEYLRLEKANHELRFRQYHKIQPKMVKFFATYLNGE